MTTDLTPEHTARRQGDNEELHPEVRAAYRYVESVLDSADIPSGKLGGPLWFGWALREAFLAGCSRAHIALAQPEPEGPTDEELIQLAAVLTLDRFQATAGDPIQYEMTEQQVHAFARAVLDRWGRPTIEPVPVAERLPGPEDCDAEGRCWWWCHHHESWELDDSQAHYRHWLPHHALPIPTP